MSKRSLLLVIYYLPIAAFLILASCSRVNHEQTAEEKERAVVLKYKIKSSKEYLAEILLGMKQPEHLVREKTFDSNGLLIKETEYKNDSTPDALLTYEYDKAGNLLLTKAVNTEGGIFFTETRNYDTNNNRKELYYYLPDGTYKYRTEAIYDSNGRMDELSYYWPDGLKSKTKYNYSGLKKTGDTEYDPAGNLRYRWAYAYDERENLTSATQYLKDSTISFKTVYQYDSENQLIQQTDYSGTSVMKTTSFEYDNRGLLVAKKEYSPTGRLTVLFRYEYTF